MLVHVCLLIVNDSMYQRNLLNCPNSLTWLTVGKTGHCLDEDTCMRLTVGDVVGFPCMAQT